MKILPFLAGIGILLLGGSVQAQTLSVASATGQPGQTVSIPITVDQKVKNLSGIQFTLSFSTRSPANVSLLSVQNPDSITPGALMPGALLEIDAAASTQVTVGLVSTKGATGPGTVLTLPFAVPSNAPNGATYTLRLSAVAATNPSGASMTLKTQNGSLKVQGTGGGGNPPPSTAPTGITLSRVTGQPGAAVKVDLTATSDLKGFSSLEIGLQFDPSLTTSDAEVVSSGFISGIFEANAATPGSVKIGIVGTKNVNGPGTLAEITFHIPSNAPVGTVYPITVASLSFVDNQSNTLNFGSSDGQVQVVSTPATLTPVPGGELSLQTQTTAPGGVAKVSIVANAALQGMSGAKFELVLSGRTPANAPDPVVRTDAAAGAVLPKALIDLNANNPEDIVVGIASGTAGNGPGVLATISFDIPKTATNGIAYTFTLKNIDLSINGTDMTSDASGTVLTIQGRLKGHVAGDGTGPITSKDAILALEASIGLITLTPDQFNAADLNGDGTISISEVSQILKASTGLITLGD